MNLLKLFVAHFLGDFVLQGRRIAGGKATHWGYWLLHVLELALVTALLFYRQITVLWPILTVTVLTHGLIDLLTSRAFRANWRVLVADQLIHWVTLPLILAAYDRLPWTSITAALRLLDDRVTLTVILGYSFSLFFGSVFVERVCDTFDLPAHEGEDPVAAHRERGASTFIGFVERFLVTTFIFFGQYGAVGFVFAAKSIGKFTEGADSPVRKRFPAYYLVGTLASLAVAVLAGLFLRWCLTGQVM